MPPLKNAGKVLKKLCAMQSPNVVRLAKSEETLAIAKMCRRHERQYYEIIQEKNVLPPFALPKIIGYDDNLIIFSNIQPYRGIKTLKDALNAKVDIKIMKSIIAQIVALLIYAQEHDHAFAHNDLKADNILLTPSEDVEIGIYEIKTFGVGVVFIDFETVTGSNFPKLKIETTRKTLLEFGLDDSLPFSQWTDLHLVFMEILRYDIPGFSEFLERFYPLSYFHTYPNELVTSQNRLNAKGRSVMNSPLSALMSDPFFQN